MSFRRLRWLALAAALVVLSSLSAHATLPEWLQHVVGASSVEQALYRVMSLPAVQALYPRPPKEAQDELAKLIAAAPEDAELYTLRAQADEAALDFAAAESDWKQAAQQSRDRVAATLALADFYQRRLATAQEVAALREVAAAPSPASERFVDAAHQRSWLVFDRLLALEAEQGLAPAQTAATYQAMLARYPAEPEVSTRYFTWLLSQKDWPSAEALIARYGKAFPQDKVFPIRAQALLEYRRGNIDEALAVYARGFQPLWPAELVQSWFGLLAAAHRERAFVAAAREDLAQHPEGPQALNALARLFYYDQQAGRIDRAEATLDSFRSAREARGAAWTADDLYTLAALAGSIHSSSEAARYDFALASTPGNLPGNLLDGEPCAQAGTAALVQLLLAAPDQPIALGAGNLALYKDIATLDQGPGYWNGILSLWLNGAQPEAEYNNETAKAQSYFHRAKAAELLTQLDQRFPAAAERAGLHAELIQAYAGYGESPAVIASAQQYLSEFKTSPRRMQVAGLLADAYARKHDLTAEFALYDLLLTELAAHTDGLPLTAGRGAAPGVSPENPHGVVALNPDAPAAQPDAAAMPNRAAAAMQAASFVLTSSSPSAPLQIEAVEYTQILDRYLGRLVAEKQLPQALAVLRRQLDRNPNDPLLYERLATFLAQNNLSQQQEAVYREALARFSERSWYDRLARLYLRERNREAYVQTTHQVADIFSGTELDRWFRGVGTLPGFNTPGDRAAGPQLALQLNLYAQHRFPHDLVFTRNLLSAYQSGPTKNSAAYEALLRAHWWEADDLRTQFFASLASSGKLQAELAQLTHLRPAGSSDAKFAADDPAAARELAEADQWSSHFEAAAPLMGQLAALYPADESVGDEAVSLFRSMAYQDATASSTQHAVAIESNLLAASPGDADRLTTLGDLYAEATANGGEDLAAAAPFWRRIPTLHPGTPAGYLTAATIFWDYFQFDDALAEIKQARSRFAQPTLFGYEAGAIAENQHDLQQAVTEYTAVATRPPATRFFLTSLNGAMDALRRPPSDAADSNLQATTQRLFNSTAARERLLQLARRPATRGLVDAATAAAWAAQGTPAALTLRADVLLAERREAELPALLDAALARTSASDEAAAIGELARAHAQDAPASQAQLQAVSVDPGSPARVNRGYTATGSYNLASIYAHALEREIVLSSDPLEKIQLSYTLANSLEAHNDLAAATRVIEQVHAANPRLLGVVRATTDYFARTGQAPRAIATLLDAARIANPQCGREFTLEAAQKANEAGATGQARALAEPLLQATPYDATVLGILAASYARADDDAGLKAFYVSQLDAVKTAALAAEDRKADTALLRRGLIPALTRLKDYEGATAQYIALLSAYPQDAAIAQQAALFALRYNRQSQLLGFLRDTVQHSPRDSRFAILLAQVETTLDDLPAAVAAYSKAIAIRKDRADLYTARADLELRLGLNDPAQNEAAAADYTRLYTLSYQDPVWMLRLAALRARQGRSDDAVKALTTAYITGQPASAANSLRVADQLAKWNLLAPARSFAEQGIALAGPRLLTVENAGSASIYARIITRLGRPTDALATLESAFRATDTLDLPPEIALGYARNGISAQDIARDRQAYRANLRTQAETELNAAIRALGQTVQAYYTPEQKLALAQALDGTHQHDPQLAIAAAAAAGLLDREAAWRRDDLLTATVSTTSLPSESAYVALERRRLNFIPLAQTLEAFAARVPARVRTGMLVEAAQAYRDAGDEVNELRLTRTLLVSAPQLQQRLFDLLLRHDRPGLIALAGRREQAIADAAANYAVAHATQAQALAAVQARSRGLGPVWRPAVASLVQTNFVNAATAASLGNFDQALQYDASIAQRLATPADPARQLTGDPWFFYATRLGLYLAAASRAGAGPDAEAFLPAELERAPSAVASYLELARDYADGNNLSASATQYTHALELAPDSPAMRDEFAVVLFRAGRREEAQTQWRAALALLSKRQSGEEFFAAFKSVVAHLHERNLFATYAPALEAVLQPYLARNGNYRSNELLREIYQASPTPGQGTALLLTAAGYAADPLLLLDELTRGALEADFAGTSGWLQPASLEAISLRQIELARARPASAADSNSALRGYQNQLFSFYLEHHEVAKAQALFDSMRPDPAYNSDADLILLAAHGGRLAALLSRWQSDPDTLPQLSALEAALATLRRKTASYQPDPALLRSLQELLFQQKLLAHQLQPTDFLALAQSRLETGDTAGALDLLHRLTLQPSARRYTAVLHDAEDQPDFHSARAEQFETSLSPWTNTDEAARLLESTGHDAEAVPFLQSLAASVPWNTSYRMRLAEAQLKLSDPSAAADSLHAITRSADAPYDLRVQAAEHLAALSSSGSVQPPNAPATELSLLTSVPHPTPAAARQPYFAAARVAAAAAPGLAKADRAALLHEAIAIAPEAREARQAKLDLLLLQTPSEPSSATLAIYNSLSNSDNPAGPQASPADQPDEAADETPSAASPSSPLDEAAPAANFPLPAARALDRATQIRLATLLASAFQRDGDPHQSLFFDRLAVAIDALNPKADPVVVKRLHDYEQALALEQQNAARRPLVHAALDQPRNVRPRLTAADLARAEAP